MSAEKPPNQPNDAESPLSPEFDEEGIVQAAQTEIAEITPPDPLVAAEETYLAMGESLEETKRKQELGEQHEVHLTRLGYVPKLFWLIVGWLVVASAFLAFAGFGFYGFTLSEKVLIALITSTTANVLGLFYVVAKWLYPAPLVNERRIKKRKLRVSRDAD